MKKKWLYGVDKEGVFHFIHSFLDIQGAKEYARKHGSIPSMAYEKYYIGFGSQVEEWL